MTELLPCPFCGGEAELMTEHDHSWIRHDECGLYFEGGFVVPEDAIAAWNRRAANSAGGVDGALENSVRRLRDILGEWTRYHSDEVTSDIDAALYEADKLLSAFPAVKAEPVALTDEKVTLHRFRPTGAENWSEWRVGPVRFSDRVLSGMEAQQSDFYTHPSSPVSAEVTEDLIEVCKKLLDYRDARYVPNMLFVRLSQALAALNGGRENG